MNELKFNSQVCTTKEQSQRLLELGLKPETADMYYTTYYDANDNNNSARYICVRHKRLPLLSQDISAWSLHRLMVIGEMGYMCFHDIENAYNTCVKRIEENIRFGLFNKEYLKL